MPEPEGRIITFYSYKGGTGRSMVLANVAWILASSGKRVLAVDWDLEAPGLHRYFYPFLLDKDLTSSNGVINFITDYKVKAMTPPPPGETLAQDWYVSQANISRYACALRWDYFAPGGKLEFVPAGRQDPSYSTLVNSFDWQEFYEQLGGGKFLEAARQHMKRNYDYVLIDSRTGVSDTSGICTVQLPDDLVVCYTLNNQSIRGAAVVAATAAEARGAGLRIFPVPMRVDPFEKDKLEVRRQLAKERFAAFPAHLNVAERESAYRATTQVPYIPYYAYEEILATFGDTVPAASGTLLESVERITSYLVDPKLKASPVREGLRQRVLAEFKGESPEPLVERAEEALAQFSPEDHEIAKWLLTRLVRVGDPHEHADDKPVPFNLRDPDPSTGRVVDRLVEAGLLTSRRGEIRFANDGFVRSWQRLKEWIDDDREFLFWRQGLAKIASDWSDVRDPALLLKGSDLKMAENWLLRRKGDLLPIEIEFSQASRRKSKRWELVKQAMSIAFTVAVTGAIVYWAAERRWNPDLLGQASISGVGGVNLTPISSETLLTTDIAGARIWNAKSAQTLFSQTGSFNQSARGNYLLNVSGNDRSAEVVQTLTRVKYKIPFGPDEQPPFFDESEEFVLIHGLKRSSENAPATVRIWNLAAQQQAGEVKTPYAPQAYVTSAGDRFIDSWGLWDVRTGSLLSDLIPRRKGTAAPKYGVTTPSDLRPSTRVRAPSPPDPLNDGNVRPLSFGVSEKVARIVSLTGRKDQPSWLGLWDLKTGAELRSAPLPPALQDVFRAGGWLSVVGLSPDGSLVFLLGQGTGAVLNTSDFGLSASCPQPGSTLTGVSGGEQKVDTVCSAKDSPDLVLWDLYSPQPIVLKGFSLPTLRAGSAVVISGDQSRLLALRQTGQAELWDCGSGRKIRNLDLAYKDVSGNQVADSRAATGNFTMDGSAVSVRLEGGAIMLYAAGTGARLAVLQNAGGTRQEVYFDGACRRANVWTDTGRVLRYTEGKTIVRWFIPSKACGK